MVVHDRFTPLDTASGSRRVDLFDTRVRSLEAMQTLLEQGTEAVVGLHGIHEKGVTTGLGLLKDVQEGGARWLLLVRDIAMPGYAACALPQFVSISTWLPFGSISG